LDSRERWYKLNEAQSAEADEEAAHDDPSRERQDWFCVYCYDLPTETSPSTLESVKSHLELTYGTVLPALLYNNDLIFCLNRHDIALPMCNRHYAKTFESPQISPNTKPFHSAFMYLQLPD
jgi:hypothetical protein